MALRPSPARLASATTAAPAAPLLTLDAATLATPQSLPSTGVAALTRSTAAASCAVPAAPAHAAAPADAIAMYGAVSAAVDAATGSTDACSACSLVSAPRRCRDAPIAPEHATSETPSPRRQPGSGSTARCAARAPTPASSPHGSRAGGEERPESGDDNLLFRIFHLHSFLNVSSSVRQLRCPPVCLSL